MSQKTRKSTTTTTRTFSTGSSVLPEESFEASDSFGSNSSRLTRTRVEEKQKLSNLNDRLAGYIEKVRSLEQENATLHATIREVEVTERKEREDGNSEWKAKVDELRSSLEHSNRERAKAEIQAKKALNEADQLRDKFTKAERELNIAVADRDRIADQVNDLKAENKRIEGLKNKYARELEDAKQDIDRATNTISALQQQIEEEFLLRTRLQDTNTSLKEDIETMKRMHDTELDEVYKRREVEMTTVQRQYEHKMNDAVKLRVKELRAEFDQRLRESRQELEGKWRHRVEEALSASDNKEAHVLELREENVQLRKFKKEFEDENAKLRRHQEELQARLKDLEGQVRVLHDKVRAKDEQIDKLQAEIDQLNREYQDLLDVKVQLDNELATYHQLLQTEETRLKIRTEESDVVPEEEDDENDLHVSFNESNLQRLQQINESRKQASVSPRRGVKRRRLEEESYFEGSGRFDQTADVYRTHQEAKGDVIVSAVDPEGRFVKIENKGDVDVPLGGWIIAAQDNVQEVRFKFHSRQHIKAGTITTVWSANVPDRENDPAGNNLTLKNQQWPKGDERRIQLLNTENEEQAVFEKYRSTRSINEGNGDDRCSIM
ncbi:unnamed protein product [Bursaphelenchus xylophilus]|uniref:(pine wood nematode) hypothetical protein n=1 Tax=Bursaphelenchus xylophilus TaxID=6326 RepID=A0A1I7S1K0_BURXY|nr:unnamed protein product [Bursaphelenchus xylophilus]CAG9081370.1 unnamed protein product [Bursaphelenchus xylophilus]